MGSGHVLMALGLLSFQSGEISITHGWVGFSIRLSQSQPLWPGARGTSGNTGVVDIIFQPIWRHSINMSCSQLVMPGLETLGYKRPQVIHCGLDLDSHSGFAVS